MTDIYDKAAALEHMKRLELIPDFGFVGYVSMLDPLNGSKCFGRFEFNHDNIVNIIQAALACLEVRAAEINLAWESTWSNPNWETGDDRLQISPEDGEVRLHLRSCNNGRSDMLVTSNDWNVDHMLTAMEKAVARDDNSVILQDDLGILDDETAHKMLSEAISAFEG